MVDPNPSPYGELPSEPEFMGLGPVGGGKRCMLAGMALTATRMTPQPNLHRNPYTLRTMSVLTEPDGWGVPATSLSELEPRGFNFRSNINSLGPCKDYYLRTVNYAPEYNAQVETILGENTAQKNIEKSVLANLIKLLKNTNNLLVLFDTERFVDNNELFNRMSVDVVVENLASAEIIPVFTKTDYFIHSNEHNLEIDLENNPDAFRKFVHKQFWKESEAYSSILELSDHLMGYPIMFETKFDGYPGPKFPIKTRGFKRVLETIAE